ncbi:MAG: hypothetical protein ABIP55_14475 [Tepidisphaeraceae bacterium]
MKRILTAAMALAFGLSILGCRASGELGDDDHDRDSSYKKTTKVERDGDTTVKTERKVN